MTGLQERRATAEDVGGQTVLAVFRQVFPQFEPHWLSADMQHGLGLDSFDLLTLRATLERELNRRIPDQAWLDFRTLGELHAYFENQVAPQAASETGASARSRRTYEVNMPHMAIGGLSEAWLFRELGDMHWNGICTGLATRSHDIADDVGNRLYATFIRIRWEGTGHLKVFGENDPITLENRLSRYGGSLFLSECGLEGAGSTISARMASTFSFRQSGNTSLQKGAPHVPDDCAIEVLDELPAFVGDYRRLRSREKRELALGGETVPLFGDTVFETTYALNPYHDFNGVNLLYFAAYPSIADTCERRYMHAHRAQYGLEGDWSLASSTCARDVSYFRNCDIDDEVVYRLEGVRVQKGGRAVFAASLYRASDGECMASVNTVKVFHG